MLSAETEKRPEKEGGERARIVVKGFCYALARCTVLFRPNVPEFVILVSKKAERFPFDLWQAFFWL